MSDDANDELGSNLPQLDHDGNGKAGGSKKKAAKGMPERVWIHLEENDDIPPTGLYLGHNGTGYLIKPGEPVSVPSFLLGILDAAVMTASITDPVTRQVIGHRERIRYPYRLVAAQDVEE